MKLRRLEFRNFKLLDGVVVQFSDSRDRPLTVIRAANGSGKTSILWGLTWAFYGERELPIANPRLGPSWQPIGTPIVVQVIVDFTHDLSGESVDYVLTRSVEETPTSIDDIQHQHESVRLVQRTAAGEEEVKNPEDLLRQMFPLRLKDTFLTDGDKVQGFVSGGQDKKEQQEKVKQAIRAVLGIDSLEVVRDDVENVERKLRKELAAEGGKQLNDAQDALAACEAELGQLAARRSTLEAERSRIDDGIKETEAALSELRGIGDIDTLNAQLASARVDAERVDADFEALYSQIRVQFKSSELFSWGLAEDALRAGQKVLADLADRGVIPGHSIGVLQDRLELRECICGESLADGTAHRQHVLDLLEEQAKISQEREQLTATFHRTRAGLNEFESACADHRDFESLRQDFLARHVELVDRQRDVGIRRREAESKMEGIDEARVQALTTRLAQFRQDLLDRVETIGGLDRDIRVKGDEATIAQKRFDEAQKEAKSSAKAQARYDIATDLRRLVEKTIEILKSDCITAVSDRMNDLFMSIVGSDPELAGAVFRKVAIDETFEIVVESGEGAHLDPDFELNGASQRALTLSFIWALMEVADFVAPRVIDTPLGMTSGGVKERMVDAISMPVDGHGLDYQIVLLLTPSEIRDIEPLLTERAGVSQTLSCSKDFPAELVNDWGVSRAVVRVCSCAHNEFCDVCERRTDSAMGLVRRTA